MVDQIEDKGKARFLFAACFVSLVATSFAFIIRIMLMGEWQIVFALSETQKGEINDQTALYDFKKTHDGDFSADKRYQTLVRNTYDHLVREEGDKERKSHGVMVSALTNAKIFVDEDQYDRLTKDKNLVA